MSSWYPSRTKPFLGNFIQRFAELLATKYKVTVLYTTSDEAISEIEIDDKSNCNLREIVIYYPKSKFVFSKIWNQFISFRVGLKMIKNVDVLNASVLFPKGFQFVMAKRHFKKPLFLFEHGSYFRDEIREGRSLLLKFYFAFLVKQIDKVIVVSEVLKEDISKDFKNNDISILPNAIDTKLFCPASNTVEKKSEITSFLHVSTLDEAVKDPKGIIDACKLLVNGGQRNFHLTIISDEPYSKWATYLYSKNIVDFVTFLGPLSDSELVPFYQAADAFVLFSKYETFSIVLAEAWSCGLPVITTPVGIGKDLLPELGYQVEIGNPENLAKAMYQIISKKDHFNPVFIRNHSKSFSKEQVLKEYIKLIDQNN